MACDTAFRVVTRRCLADLTANHATTCRGDPEALHQMRVALARLRTAISFFTPMVADSQRKQIRAELKWLRDQLGAVRDLDVAIGRLEAANQQRPHDYRPWKAKRAQAYRRLAAGAPLGEVSAADQKRIRLDRERSLVQHHEKACLQGAGFLDRGV